MPDQPVFTTTTDPATAPTPALVVSEPMADDAAGRRTAPATDGEDGSLVSEYGLVAVLGATIAGVAISWARGGAVAALLDALLREVRVLVGA